MLTCNHSVTFCSLWILSRCSGSQPAGDYKSSTRLPLLSARPQVTFPAAEHHHPLAGTRLYCLMTEAHRCEQLAQGCYAAFAPSRILTHDLLIAILTLYVLRHLVIVHDRILVAWQLMFLFC